jgi:ribosomal protein S18 acetylase RimI-like enzyme
LHILPLNLDDEVTTERILAIQQAAYRIEAELIGFYEIPPLFDTKELLLKSGETFYGAIIDGVIAGIIACELKPQTLDICRLGVYPDYFRRGVASALLHYIEATAYPDQTHFSVSTGAKNLPARRLYENHGFVLLQEYPVEPGLLMAFYEKKR